MPALSVSATLRERFRRLRDPLRCRYDDCVEQHPVAVSCDDAPSERVTCPTCREWLGLPPIGEE